MNEPTFSIIVPTIGRKTLQETLDSITPQRAADDEVIVVFDGKESEEVNRLAESHSCLLANTGKRSYDAGSTPRNFGIDKARGDWLLFMDDDDIFTENALTIIRKVIVIPQQPTPHIFRMRCQNGIILWREPRLEYANVGTPMFVVPRLNGNETRWRSGDSGSGNDFAFIIETLSLRKQTPIWSEEIICLVRPNG